MRSCCLAATLALLVFAVDAQAQGGQTDFPDEKRSRGANGRKAEHPRHLRRRHRDHQCQRLQRRTDGLRNAQHRPHREGRASLPAILRRAVVHRRSLGVPDGAARHPHRPDQGRFPGRTDGDESARSFHRRDDEEPRLRHRTVRQEPRRRPQRDAADGQWLRRVLRQSLPPERRGGAGAARLSEGPGVPQEVRPAWRAPDQGDRQG